MYDKHPNMTMVFAVVGFDQLRDRCALRPRTLVASVKPFGARDFSLGFSAPLDFLGTKHFLNSTPSFD